MTPCRTQMSPICWSSSCEKIFPRGLCGVLITTILVRGVIAFSNSSMFRVHSEAEHIRSPPWDGGWRGTHLTIPPGMRILSRYLFCPISPGKYHCDCKEEGGVETD